MAADGWAQAQSQFDRWPDPQVDPGATGATRRLGDALQGLRQGTAGWRDVAALTRQVLLEAKARGNHAPLSVPGGSPLPTAGQWAKAQCDVQPAGSHLKIWARPWNPGVADGPSALAAEADLQQVYLGPDSRQRRRLDNCPADPFWTETLGHTHYLSVGQRQAARTVALAPPASTTIVCLPTGHGKTDVVLACALLGHHGAGTCLIVVPTVVLAMDMERRVRHLLGQSGRPQSNGCYAYTGDLPSETKRQIADDVRAGRQRVLIAAPEAVTHGLLRPLEQAAGAGLITHCVIDEAHLVDQWGNDFRPAFQTIASQRQAWIRSAPQGRAPRTVALSATLTDSQVDTLTVLFGSPGPVETVWASELRSEPSYYTAQFPDIATREQAVTEAATLLPRPMVLYVSKREDARAWVSRLRSLGMLRVADVTGDTESAARWATRTADGAPVPSRLDVVVGTSAFGLGVDLPDVKTVVHACLPETVDRFYQEVGRGGRNGSPSLSYMATVAADVPIARKLNAQVIITARRAWERWDAMFGARQPGNGPVYHLDLETWPADMSEGYGLNQTWNIRVLNLLARARLIDLYVPEVTPHGAGQSEITAPADVSLPDPLANDRDHFTAVITQARAGILSAQKAALWQLRTALRGDRCISEVLADYYVLPTPHGDLLTSPWCRGCPHCRESGPVDGFCRTGWRPRPVVAAWPQQQPDPLASFRQPGQGLLSIWWDSVQERRDLVADLITRLCRAGIAAIGGPGMDWPTATRIQREARPHPVILDRDADLLATYPGPVIWVLGDELVLDPDLLRRMESADVTYLLHQRQLADPGKQGALLADLRTASVSVQTAGRTL
jgi:ATP-dependent DNA helicase RecQ